MGCFKTLSPKILTFLTLAHRRVSRNLRPSGDLGSEVSSLRFLGLRFLGLRSEVSRSEVSRHPLIDLFEI